MMYSGVSSFAVNNLNVPAASPLGFNNGGCLLIDWGFSWRHDQPLPAVLDYAGFSRIIQEIINSSPAKGKDMLEWHSYFWFAEMFYDNVFPLPHPQPQPAFNDNKCRRIFSLFQYFETYRTNYERYQLQLLQRLEPEGIEYYIDTNTAISQSVDAYIASLPPQTPERKLVVYNTQGGGRRRIYNAIKRKETKITKKHSRNRSRSRSRRRSRRSRSCRTKLK